MGQQMISALTNEYQKANSTFQIADVSRSLTSVGAVCDRGNVVVFGPEGGYILSMEGGSSTKFERNGGKYELELWLDVLEYLRVFRGQIDSLHEGCV